jgi:hypothetical protein
MPYRTYLPRFIRFVYLNHLESMNSCLEQEKIHLFVMGIDGANWERGIG